MLVITSSWIKGISKIETSLNNLKGYDFEVILAIRQWENTKELDSFDENKKVRIIKNIARDQLYNEFFSKIDFLIIPSIWEETGPLTLLESLYYNVAVIISDNKSMVEKIGTSKIHKVFKNEKEWTLRITLIGRRKRMASWAMIDSKKQTNYWSGDFQLEENDVQLEQD